MLLLMLRWPWLAVLFPRVAPVIVRALLRAAAAALPMVIVLPRLVLVPATVAAAAPPTSAVPAAVLRKCLAKRFEVGAALCLARLTRIAAHHHDMSTLLDCPNSQRREGEREGGRERCDAHVGALAFGAVLDVARNIVKERRLFVVPLGRFCG